MKPTLSMTASPVEVSVIIPSFNQPDLLKQCLTALSEGISNITCQVIVADNASRDNSIKIVTEQFPEVTLLRNETNVGFARAVNQGIKAAQGQYLLLLNSDVVVIPGTVANLADFLKRTRQAGAVGAKLLNPDGTIQIQGSFTSAWIWPSRKPRAVRFMPFACFMLKREVVAKIGLLDENFFFYNEDLDYCRRLIKAGYQIFYLPQAAVTHLGGGSTKELGEAALFEGYKGGLYFCRKHYPGWISWLYQKAVFAEIALKRSVKRERAAAYAALSRRLKAWLDQN